MEIHQKFLISLRTENRGGHDYEYSEVNVPKCLAKVFDNRLVEDRITDYASLANQSFSYLKLRLDKADDMTGPLHEFQNRRDHKLK